MTELALATAAFEEDLADDDDDEKDAASAEAGDEDAEGASSSVLYESPLFGSSSSSGSGDAGSGRGGSGSSSGSFDAAPAVEKSVLARRRQRVRRWRRVLGVSEEMVLDAQVRQCDLQAQAEDLYAARRCWEGGLLHFPDAALMLNELGSVFHRTTPDNDNCNNPLLAPC